MKTSSDGIRVGRRSRWARAAWAGVLALTIGAGAVGGSAADAAPTGPAGKGYWLAAADGGVFAFGDAPYLGSAAGISRAPIIGLAPTSTGQGYWLAASDGGVFSFGDARFFGSLLSLPEVPPGQTVVSFAATQIFGDGYYLVTRSGGVYTLGGAPFFGAPASGPVPNPIVDFGLYPGGHGYWLLDSAGHLYAYGAAPALTAPEVDPATAPSLDRRVALAVWSSLSVHVLSAGGGVFTASTSPATGFFYGSAAGGPRVSADIAGCGCAGYWVVDVAGTVRAFGAATSYGSVTDVIPPGGLNGPIVAMMQSTSVPS